MTDIIIVGAGLAGLTCANELTKKGLSVQIVEASDEVGGRVRTDLVDEFRLDRGFQVFLDSYPHAKAILDYRALNLKPFWPGALIRYQGKFYPLADPWRRPMAAASSLLTPIGSFGDKLRIAKLRSQSLRGSVDDTFSIEQTTTLKSLQQLGFSQRMIDQFFKPFLGGIFLDGQLSTSNRMLNFVFRMFSTGLATLPADGMQAIPRQLAERLPADTIRLNQAAVSVTPNQVTLASGETLSAKSVVIATEAPAAKKLLQNNRTDSGPLFTGDDGQSIAINEAGQGVTCFYFSTPNPPTRDPLLILNGDGSGPVNNLAIPSNVTSSYAPAGQSLISVTVLGTDHKDFDQLLQQTQQQLAEWYGSAANKWKFLKQYVIPYALPNQFSPMLASPKRPIQTADGIYLCGDHRDNASINGAMESGSRTAAEIIKQQFAN